MKSYALANNYNAMTNVRDNKTVSLGKNLKSMAELSKHYDPE